MKKRLILDLGHGINTHGKRSPIYKDGFQLFEWKFNRLIGEMISAKIDKSIEVVTTCGDYDMSLSARVAEINRLSNGYDALAISIHGNAFSDQSIHGFEVFTHYNASLKSKQLATEIFNQVHEFTRLNLRPCWSSGDPSKQAYFTVLGCNCPIVLTENGFYTNEEQARWMMSDNGVNQIAGFHVAAIEKVFGI